MFGGVLAKGLMGGAIGIATYLFGAADNLMLALIAMVGIDFVTGIIKAVMLKEVASHKMFMGGAQKVGVFLIVAVANLIDGVLELGGVLRTVTISYFIANEGISMLENWALMGLPMPQKLQNILAGLQGKGKE
ncbi:MAG: phage holin family protein [Defluviitaleaceae bacterium]|nr:phage holin family protein [Defluviitaleaceae bacterium]